MSLQPAIRSTVSTHRIDFEKQHIFRQRFIARGRYLRPDTSQFLHLIQLEMGPVPTLNGMSGGPVFWGGANERWAFAGILVRGNDGGLARFMDVMLIAWMIRSQAPRGGKALDVTIRGPKVVH
jgi:hypothetical protein